MLGRGGFNAACAAAWPLPNVWLGVSVEDQATAYERIPLLLQTAAAVRFVSYEPALGPVDFDRWLPCDHGIASTGDEGPVVLLCRSPERWRCDTCHRKHDSEGKDIEPQVSLDWLIVGGESGPGARSFDLAWARSAIAQCRDAGVPVFMKQLGARPFSWTEGRRRDGFRTATCGVRHTPIARAAQ